MEIVTVRASTAPMIAVYGPPGAGKTSLSARFPNPVHILCEDGLPAGIEVQSFGRIEGYDQVMSVLRWLFEGEHTFKTVVIDTLDSLEAMILAHVCRENKWANIETPPYGKGWVIADDAWRRILSALDHVRRKRSMTVVLLAHSTIERIDDPRAPSYTAFLMRLHRRSRALVMDACDVVAFLSTDLHVVNEDRGFSQTRTRGGGGSQRYLFTEARPAFAAKNRYGLPEKIPVGRDFNIAELTKYFPTT